VSSDCSALLWTFSNIIIITIERVANAFVSLSEQQHRNFGNWTTVAETSNNKSGKK